MTDTTPINCRALCIELLDKYDLEWRARERLKEVLAQPKPEGPTVMEIIALADEIEAEGLGQVDLVRRALARWGRALPTPQP